MAFGDVWRVSLRHRLVYGTAGALIAIVSFELMLFLYEIADPKYYGESVQELRDFKGLPQIIMAAGFLAGAATWYPPGRHEPSIDTLRLTGTMVGLTFWIPGLMLPIIVWLAYPRDIASAIPQYLIMSIFGCAVGGAVGAFMAGPVAYLIGALFLAPMRHFERSMFPTAIASTNRRWFGIANALFAILAVLAAAIASISTLFYGSILVYSAALRLLTLL